MALYKRKGKFKAIPKAVQKLSPAKNFARSLIERRWRVQWARNKKKYLLAISSWDCEMNESFLYERHRYASYVVV